MMQNEPPKNYENIDAQFSIINPTIRPPQPEDIPFISAPEELPFKIPFVSDERARYWVFSTLVFRYYARFWLFRIAHNPYFIILYILTALGAFTSMRAFYKDQLFTYGLRHQLPGIAHQFQTQTWPTFHFVTCPKAVAESRRLFGQTAISDVSNATTSSLPSTTNPFVLFLETPFLERLDFYPNAAVISFSDYWTSLLTNSLIGAWAVHSSDDPRTGLHKIPQNYVIKTLSPLEFAFPPDRVVLDSSGIPIPDPWGAERTRMDLSDELPLKIKDRWTRRQRKVYDILGTLSNSVDKDGVLLTPEALLTPQPLLVNEFLRLREHQNGTLRAQEADRKPPYYVLRKNFINWVFSNSHLDETLLQDLEATGIGFSGVSSRGRALAPPSHSQDVIMSDSAPLQNKLSLDKSFDLFEEIRTPGPLKRRKKPKKGQRKSRVRFPRLAKKKINKYEKNFKRRNQRLQNFFIDPLPRLMKRIFYLPRNPQADPLWNWWNRNDANWPIQPPTAMLKANLVNLFDRLPPADMEYYRKEKRPVLPQPPENPYPKLSKAKSTKSGSRRLVEHVFGRHPIRMFTKPIPSQAEDTVLPPLEKGRVISVAEAIKRKLPFSDAVKVVSPSMRRLLIRLRAYRLAYRNYRKQKQIQEKKLDRYNAVTKTVKEFHRFWDDEMPKALHARNLQRYQVLKSIRQDLKRMRREKKRVFDYNFWWLKPETERPSFMFFLVPNCPDYGDALDQIAGPLDLPHGGTMPDPAKVLVRDSCSQLPLIEMRLPPNAFTGDALKRALTLLTGRVVTTDQPTIADFRALTRMMVGPNLTKGQPLRDDSIRKILQKQLRKAEKKGYREFYTLLRDLGFSEGPRKLLYPATKPFVKFDAKRNRLRKADSVQFYFLLEWLYHSYLLAQEEYTALSSEISDFKQLAQNRKDMLFNECMMRAVQSAKYSLVKGNEFHWLHYMDQLMSVMTEPEARKMFIQDLKQTKVFLEIPKVQTGQYQVISRRILKRAVQVLNGKTDKRHYVKLPESFLEDERYFISELRRGIQNGIRRGLGRLPLTQVMRQKYPNGVKLAEAFSRINMYATVFDDIASYKSQSSALVSVPSYRDAFARVVPEMFGYLFPDMEGKIQTKAFSMSWLRYKLGQMSLWDAFRTMTKVRPLEIILPPGFRFYNADIFGFPTLPLASTKDLIRAKIFPSYKLKRTKSLLPPYETLQKIYGDLDVSFLVEPPKVGYPLITTDYDVTKDPGNKEQSVSGMEETLRAKEKEISDLESLKQSRQASGTDLEKLTSLKKEVLKLDKQYRRVRQMRRQPNYYEFNRTLTRKDGDVDVPAHVFTWVTDFLLSPMNWMKDRMYINFMGQAGHLRGERTTFLTEALQRRQMGAKPNHDPESMFHEEADELVSSPNDLPSVFDGYAPDYVYEYGPPALHRFLKELSSQEDEAKPQVQAAHEGEMAAYWEDYEDDETISLPEKYLGQLHTLEHVYMPQLTMSEWHEMYKTILASAKSHPESGFLLHIPVPPFMVGSRPVAFTGEISPGGDITDPKVRARALAQVLMLANNPYYGSADDLEYHRLQTLGTMSPASRFAANLRPGPPIVWHYHVPFGQVCPEALGAPTILSRTHKRQATFQTQTWLGYKKYMAEQSGKKPERALVTYFPSWLVKLIRLFPGGKRALKPNRAFQANREPVHMYWWYVAAKVYFFALSFKVVKLIAYVVGKGTMYKTVLRLPLRSQRQLFRDFFLLIGVIKDERIRVIYDTPRRFKDLIGITPELLSRAGEIVWHLRNKRRPGGPVVPKGILLAGPPGTGKTYLVQAIAGESGVPVVAQSTNMYLDKTKFISPVYGLYTSFQRARKLAPSILFIDEIDGMGRSREKVVHAAAARRALLTQRGGTRIARTPVTHLTRGPGMYPSSYVKAAEELFTVEERMKHERNPYIEDVLKERIWEYERDFDFEPEPELLEYFYEVLNVKAEVAVQDFIRFALLIEFLVQLDGLKQYQGVLVMGATNRYGILDRAMVRPGRLEETIFVHLPSFNQRTDILKFYAAPFGYESDVSDNWEYLSHRTRGYSIADIATAINHSAVHAIVNNREMHDLDTLDFGLDEIELHKRLRGNLLPHPRVKKVPPLDPIYFARQAYYQAGRALIHNILPTHPNLPYVTMQYMPFLPEESLQKLYSRQLDRFEFEMRLAGLLAGKAAEYLYLYGGSFKSKKARTERQLWESDCGLDEVGFATDMALHIVDTWLMLDEVRTNVLQETHVSEIGDIPEIYSSHAQQMPWLLETWLHERHKDYTHMFSKYDDPFRNRISVQVQHLSKWIGETKVVLTTAVGEFSEWWSFHLKSPHERPSTIGWRVRDRFLQETPRHRHPITAKNSQGHHGWMWRGKHWVWEGDTWTEKTDKWLVGLTTPTDMNYLDQVPLVSYNDWEMVDRDYLWTALMAKSFDLVYQLLDQHRPLLDRMAHRLHTKGRLRQFEIDHFIEVYTDELKEMRRIDPYETENENRLAPITRYEPNPVFYGPRREGQLPTLLTVHKLDNAGGPYPYARQTHNQSIIRERSSQELEDFLEMLSSEDQIRFEKQMHDHNIERQKRIAQIRAQQMFWHLLISSVRSSHKYFQLLQNQIIQHYLHLALSSPHKISRELTDLIVRPKPERKFHIYSYGSQGEFQIRGYRSLLDPDLEKPVTKEELAIVLYQPPGTLISSASLAPGGSPPSPDGGGQEQSESQDEPT